MIFILQHNFEYYVVIVIHCRHQDYWSSVLNVYSEKSYNTWNYISGSNCIQYAHNGFSFYS